MKQIACERESAVSKAVRSGRWDALDTSLRAHAAECAACREIVQTARSMRSLAEPPEGSAAMPEPGLVWWKAQLVQRQAKTERALNVLEWVEASTPAILAIALAGGFAWSWPRLQGPFADAMNGLWPQWWKVTWSAVSALPDFYSWQALVLAALCGVGVFLAYPLLMEE